MKKRINQLFIGAIVAGAFMLTSCGSDYLDTTPTADVGDASAASTVENAYMTLNGIAKIMTIQHGNYSQGFCGENAIYRLYENLPSQSYNYNYYASGWAVIHNQQYHTRDNSIYDNYAWYYYYQIISNANVLINRIDDAVGSEADKKFIKASALTFRAYAYQKLVLYYCYRWLDSNNGSTQGVVLRLDESTGDLPPSTLAETYAQIYKDCEDAIALFKESGITTRTGCWIADESTAHAVYARAALNRLDYAKAASEANLAKNGYPLMSTDAYLAGFCNPTSEWIFGSYGSADENNWYWSYGTQGACNGYYSGRYATGAGAIDIQLIDRIPKGDVRKECFLTHDDLEGITLDASQMNQTFGYMEGDEAWDAAKVRNTKRTISGMNAPYQLGYFYLGGHYKFYVNDQPGVGYLPFIRTSEMYLIEAEAYYKQGNEGAAKTALEALNKVRNPQYSCTKSGDDLWNEIMDYREVELWGEGFGWSDYKRWNRPVIRKSFAQGGNAHTSVAVTIAPDYGNKWTWVIPLAETDYNKGFSTGDPTAE